MKEMQDIATKLLVEGTVQVVVGYEEGPHGVRPSFARTPEEAGRLVFDKRCVHNLAAYASPRRKHIHALGKMAIVVKGCDAKALAGLIREGQVKREEIVIIGVRCGGVVAEPRGQNTGEAPKFMERCLVCDVREPRLFDHIVGELPPAPTGTPARDARIAELAAMSAKERWVFWQGKFSRCVRCHACREVCPMCFCERCVADKTMPAWIESSAHGSGNLVWHITRALHQAGRCVDCGECERACPADIPLSLLNRKVALTVSERFAYAVTDDPGVPAPIGTFRLDDEQEFIL